MHDLDYGSSGGRAETNAVIIGSPNVNPGYVLVGNPNYPKIAQDYESSFALLLNLPVDLFLGAHVQIRRNEHWRPKSIHRCSWI